MIMNLSGGGAAMNFKVVGGTSAPSNPKENCIWINTDTNITSWEFGSTEPTNPTNGMVWIHTGRSSVVKFNVMKRNAVWVYPVSAYQYISGEWVDYPAQIFQNGQWIDLSNGIIFADGKDYIGGFTVIEDNGTVIIDDTIQIIRDDGGETYVKANEAIQCDSRSELKYTIDVVVADKYNDDNHATLQVGFVDGAGEWVCSQTLNVATLTSGEHSVSIQMSGEYYLCISAFTYLHYGKLNVHITDVRMA